MNFHLNHIIVNGYVQHSPTLIRTTSHCKSFCTQCICLDISYTCVLKWLTLIQKCQPNLILPFYVQLCSIGGFEFSRSLKLKYCEIYGLKSNSPLNRTYQTYERIQIKVHSSWLKSFSVLHYCMQICKYTQKVASPNYSNLCTL